METELVAKRLYEFSRNIKKIKGVIYILLWTSPFRPPFHLLGLGILFNVPTKNCHFDNCRISTYEQLLNNVTDFDAIIFNVVNLQAQGASDHPLSSRYHDSPSKMPTHRTKEQIYIFFAIEPPCIYPLFYNFENYFNITWTYKLDSTIVFPYLHVYDKHGEVVSPKMNIFWNDVSKLRDVSDSVKDALYKKVSAAAWLASHCEANSKRDEFGIELKNELEKYGHAIDVYGLCGREFCIDNGTYSWTKCHDVFEKYYFYLAFENSICNDYISEKIFNGLKYFSVPVVYGGANFSRFLPPGSYLNARELGPAKLARIMNELILDKEKYYDYFKWHGYYSIRDTMSNVSEIDNRFCELCAFLNKLNHTDKPYIFPDIVNWWNEPNNTECRYPYTWNETVSRVLYG